jgi:hypothetical protein
MDFCEEALRSDRIRAVDARAEAQKIAFSPLTFQAVRCMRDFGVLKAVSDAGDKGLTRQEIVQKTSLSLYAVGVLSEVGLAMHVLRLRADGSRFVLGKIGFFLLEDKLTEVNFNFVNDVCYKGAFEMEAAIKNAKPCGLAHFGKQWQTIYQALSQLPEKPRESWFAFDHFYSNVAFPGALPIVFAQKRRFMLDIGGNTAKWAIACCRYDKDVKMGIADLPGQTAMAEQNAAKAGFGERVSTYPCNVLDAASALPKGADAVWMSQFLDCFSLEEITAILQKVGAAVDANADVFVLEPLTDMQQFEAASYALVATSLYYTCMANGNSNMYRFKELKDAVEQGGFKLCEAHHNLGSNAYSLLRFRKRP